ncbi:MAG: glycosyl transferase [Gammaproteobacteria bacterium]|nr:MAG: sugar transferase [Pseudomonadota bacterium]MBC6946270.1 sugar transferase [Gammaproteobacteria bacterium]MCE7897148.1 sugar transferase [Gammaproteobacteria bacterium PRO8]MDL1881623.1 sugar transferase [Gammaproteobacteria bacterium PRO2]MCL4776708.1 sugar transferase [Gammaproteobacteria bacterium]
MKRLLDFSVALAGLLLASPVLLPVMFLVWRQDRHSPFYIAPRVGRDGRLFHMVKLRSMRINADRTGVDSTSAADSRITPVGHFIRRYKLDEVTQLWNVLIGDMSLVGPRPNVERETRLYTAAEQGLLAVKPGITDYASIVFADEGEILAGHPDPDLGYNQLIRPWKSRLGLFCIQHSSIALDLKLIGLTVLAIVSRERALAAVSRDLETRGAPAELVEIARRRQALVPHPPPGASSVVQSRDAVAV